MADIQTLNIIIGANTQQADQGLQKVSKELENTAKSAKKVDESIDKAGSTVTKSTTNFTGLNRVIQDLPFGFIAISNNLEQLLPAAGALGTAFSIVISTITFLQIGFRNWTRSTKDNTEALKENEEAQKKIINSSGKEIGNLIVLTNAAKDTALAMNVRLNAVKELQKEYPQYFSNLSKEQILQGDVATAVNETTKALFAQAVVREKTTDLGPIAAQIFDLRQQRAELEKQEAVMKRMNAIAGQTRNRQGILSSLFGAGSQDRKGLIDLDAQIAAIDKELLPLQGKFKGIAQAIIDASKEAGSGLFSDDTKEKVKKLVKEFNYFTFDPNIVSSNLPKKAAELTDHLHTEVQKMIDRTPVTIAVAPPPSDELEKIAKETADIIKSTLEGSAIAIGEGLGKLFSGGKNPFAALFDVIGAGLKALGKQMIALSGIGRAIKLALSELILSPALALAAGIAAVALGAIISNIGQGGLKGFATGGVVTRPTLALIGEQGPERITPLNQINNNSGNNIMAGEVVFQINGNTLRGVLRRADQEAYNTF